MMVGGRYMSMNANPLGLPNLPSYPSATAGGKQHRQKRLPTGNLGQRPRGNSSCFVYCTIPINDAFVSQYFENFDS